MSKRRALRLHPSSSPRLLPPTTPWARRLERWLRSQTLSGQPITTMAQAADLVGFNRQSVTNWRAGRREPGAIAKRLLDAMMAGEVRPPGAP